MKKLTKYLSIVFILAFAALLAFGKVGTSYRGLTNPSGLITEAMMLLTAGNSTWNFGQDIHGFVNPPGASDGKVNRYLNGLNTWSTFPNLYRDPDGGPYPQTARGAILVCVGTNIWRELSMGSSGQVLTVGDDPGIFGADTNVFWADPSPSSGWTSLAGYFASHTQFEIPITASTSGNVLQGSGVTIPVPGSIQANYIGVDTVNAGEITIGGMPVAASAAGTYAPTLTALALCSSLTAPANFRYTRVGDIVTVFGQVTGDMGGGTVEFNMSLPVASDLTAQGELSGTGVPNQVIGSDLIERSPAQIYADTFNNAAHVVIQTRGGTFSVNVPFSFNYIVNE